MVAYRTGHNSGLARKSAGSTFPDTIRFGFERLRVPESSVHILSLHRLSPFPFTLLISPFPQLCLSDHLSHSFSASPDFMGSRVRESAPASSSPSSVNPNLRLSLATRPTLELCLSVTSILCGFVSQSLSPVVPEFQLFQNFNCSIFVFHSLKFQNCYKMVDHESGQPIGAVENLDSASIEPNPSQPVLQTENATTQIGKKRNEMKERSDIWVHFEKINDENNNLIKAKCIYCKRVWAADPKKHGTTNLRSHMVTCKQIPTLISPS
nr:zinc finger BED domain-containing protein RICESLEEPER 2-like [Ipomoea batatas]